MTAPKTFAKMMAFFGLLPGQTRKDFLHELKALPPEAKAELTTLLDAAGYPVQAGTGAAAEVREVAEVTG